jgi:hypothetical protein
MADAGCGRRAGCCGYGGTAPGEGAPDVGTPDMGAPGVGPPGDGAAGGRVAAGCGIPAGRAGYGGAVGRGGIAAPPVYCDIVTSRAGHYTAARWRAQSATGPK